MTKAPDLCTGWDRHEDGLANAAGTAGASGKPARARWTHAAAYHLVAVIGRYEVLMRKLVANQGDMHLYARAGEELDEIRRCCTDMAELSMPWAMLLIAHAELIDAVWRGARKGAKVTWADRPRQLNEVMVPSQELKRCCIRLAAG